MLQCLPAVPGLGDSGGQPGISSGEAVLAGLRVEEIATLAKTWSQFNREENPPLTMGQEEAEELKKN